MHESKYILMSFLIGVCSRLLRASLEEVRVRIGLPLRLKGVEERWLRVDACLIFLDVVERVIVTALAVRVPLENRPAFKVLLTGES